MAEIGTNAGVVYIVGAAGGLGAGVSAAFAAAGWAIGLGGRSADKLESLAASLPAGHSEVAAFNASDPEAVHSAFDRWRERLGPPDACLCLMGGYLGGRDAEEWSAEEWREQLELNLVGPALVLSSTLGMMKEVKRPGLLVAVSALAGLESPARKLPYGISKAAVLHLVRGLAEEGAPFGIRALALVPRVIDTPANRQAMPGQDSARWSSPHAIGELLAVLAGPAAGGFSGGVLRL